MDIDSTIWDVESMVREAVLRVTGDILDVESISAWVHLLDAYGEETTTRIYDRALAPERILERELYPGVRETIRSLQREHDIAIHFVTRHPFPDDIAPHLRPWLRENFGPEAELTVTPEDKLGVLRDLNAFGMIDDRSDTLARVADAGLWAAAKVQPWNRVFLDGRPDIFRFTDWREVPEMLPDAL
ncbi:MAG TPA: hypothetical protein VHM16_03865 [Rubrobacteraceae bacterium]|nr:hypothetical protein [Rubrobacteraceae bacterium]